MPSSVQELEWHDTRLKKRYEGSLYFQGHQTRFRVPGVEVGEGCNLQASAVENFGLLGP